MQGTYKLFDVIVSTLEKEDQWKAVREMAVVLKIYGNEISLTVAL